MPWKESEVVPEGNGPVHQQKKIGSGQPTLEDVCQRMNEYLDRWDKMLNEISEKMDQRLARHEQDARQSRLAMEADGQASTRTRERVEGAATAAQAMRGDCSSARQVEPGPTNSTSFGMKAEPPTLPCRDVSVVECGAAAFKSCLPPMKMRTSTAAGGLVPTGDVSKASETTLNEPPLRFCLTEETDLKAKNSWTSIPSASYNSSSVFQERNLSATPYCRRIVDTKSDKIGRLIQVVLEVTSAPARFGDRGARWFVARFEGLEQSCSVFSMIRWLFGIRPVSMPRHDKVSQSRRARGYRNSWEEQRSRRHGDSRRLEVRGERLSRSVMER